MRCDAVCPDGPYAGTTCTLEAEHHGQHQAWAEMPGRRDELLESWGVLPCQECEARARAEGKLGYACHHQEKLRDSRDAAHPQG
jgi:hypothetical protein